MKQSAVIAVEKDIKARVSSEGGKLHRASQQATSFSGHAKKYQPLNEDSEQFPDDNKKVVLRSDEVIQEFRNILSPYFDITFTKDVGNQQSSADIVMGDVVLAKDVPATTLIFLEKQLEHVRTFVEKLPTLDENENWSQDPNSGLYRTEPSTTHRTKKVQKAIVLYDATDRHPAQTQLVSSDDIVGHWHLTKYSGAMPRPRQQEILQRLNRLQQAVKNARVEANATEVQKCKLADNLFDFIFA